jgi:hypothetical protein
MKKENSIISIKNFILATRDSGYKSFSSAIAELIDNSFEANAKSIKILVNKRQHDYCVGVLDDGNGMDKNNISIALQFGGSTRFNSRKFTGRYGMGLPNSSLSHSRRVDVYSWNKKSEIWWNCLDLDEILTNKSTHLHTPEKIDPSKVACDISTPSGTLIKWSKCDRLRYKHENKLLSDLHFEIGNLFRKKLLNGNNIFINHNPVKPIDPTFVFQNINGHSAVVLGKPLKYRIKLNDSPNLSKSSEVTVTFTKLPIESWYSLSNEEKQKNKITKRAGVSLVRAGREIDYGWFFMGTKRKENYDDWWRCEICFEPYLDEHFGVTHTKQEVHPTDEIISILKPDIERIARELNRDVRERFLKIKERNKKTTSEKAAESYDHLLTPPNKSIGIKSLNKIRTSKRMPLTGIKYKILSSPLKSFDIFQFNYDKNQLTIFINEKHPFYRKIYSKFLRGENKVELNLKVVLDLIIFGHARAESTLINSRNINFINSLRREWSNNLANYLQSL